MTENREKFNEKFNESLSVDSSDADAGHQESIKTESRSLPVGNDESKEQPSLEKLISATGEAIGAAHNLAIALESVNSKLTSASQDVVSALMSIQAAIDIGRGALNSVFAVNEAGMALNRIATLSDAKVDEEKYASLLVCESNGRDGRDTFQAENGGDSHMRACGVDAESSDKKNDLRESADSPITKSDESTFSVAFEKPSHISESTFASTAPGSQTISSDKVPNGNQRSMNTSDEDHKRFFTKMLAEIDNPALPYGFSDINDDEMDVTKAHLMFPQELSKRLRRHAEKMGVSVACMCHLAWAQVVSKTSGQEQVVFGTAPFGDGSGSNSATLPLRIDVGSASVEEIVRKTQADLSALLEHEHASLELAQLCSGIDSGTPLFSSILDYQFSTEMPRVTMANEDVTPIDMKVRTRYPFMVSIEDGGDMLAVTAQVVKKFDSSRICGYMQQALKSLNDALEHTPDMQVRELEILPTDEREMLLQSWNIIETTDPNQPFIHQLFESQAKQSPDLVAVVYEGQEITYRELNARANSIAHNLIDIGVEPDSPVAVCVSRSIELIISLLAVLKAGGAYVPLDPTFAGERLGDILADASPSVLLADDAGILALGSSIPSSVVVVNPTILSESPTTNPCVPGLTPSHLAYVIYTSGSTGKPKGVMVEHAQVTRLFDATKAWYSFDQADVWIMTHTFSFDISVWEIWGSLRSGGKLVMPSYRNTQSPGEMYGLICRHGVTVLSITPSALRPLIRIQEETDINDKLRYIILVGEAIEPTILKSWYAKRSESSPQIINMYGPTETTVYSAYRVLKEQDCNSSFCPIGVRIPDLAFYVLDIHGQPVPLGAIGELCIGGAGVTRGYLNRPELSSERFPLDPFSNTPGSRMYKTGDLVRYLPDRDMIFLGRNDHQVKIRGYRIELGEIEAQLVDHPLAKEVVVLALGEGSSKRLVAYVVAEPADGLAHTLRSHISMKLPGYMIPAAYVRLDRLPLTSNGKLDRRALPEPDIDSFVSQGYEAPQSETESTLAMIWEELLKVERVGRHDNFFMLGGHSLLAVQIIERLHRVGMDISVRALFETPTLSVLAQSITKGQVVTEAPENMITLDTTRITPELLPLIDITQGDIDLIISKVNGGVANIQDVYALSPLQDGILFHHMMATIGDPYLIVTRMSFDSKDTLDRYLGAVQNVVDRHDVLRTAIVWEDLSVPAQVVLRHATISVTELSLNVLDGPIADQMSRLTDPREHRIDLTQAPLIRYVTAQDTDGHWIVVQLLHHIIGDHSTLEVMADEIHAFVSGQAQTLLKPQPFRNLIAQVRSGPGAEFHEKFFTEMLADIDTPALPYGLSDVHDDGVDVAESKLTLSLDLNNRLRDHAKKMGVGLASMCHLAWAQVISKTSGQEQVVFGTVLLGRMQGGSGSDSAMGLFINTLPLRIDVGATPLEESIRQTHTDLAALLEHEHAPLALAQRCSSILPGAPLFSAALNCRNYTRRQNDISDITGITFLDGQQRTNYPFTMSVDDYGTEIILTSQVVYSVDASRVCEYMQEALQSLVDALDNTPKMQVRDLEILPATERETLIQSWNDTTTEYPEHLCVHQLFENQVNQTPDSIAVVYEDQQLTYRDLNSRANGLAHHLIDLGVKPDSLVAICVDRSLMMIISIMAVLKAGGAYVPLDPTFASERLHNILTDASPSIMLADDAGIKALGSSISDSMDVINPNSFVDKTISNPHIPALEPHHLAYVIYTSGSTGKPKGVLIEHKGLANLALSRPSVYGVDSSSKVLQFFSLSFDASVQEIWSALCFGGSLHVLPNHTRQDQSQLWEYLERHSITHASMTPSSLQQHQILPPLETPLTLILGGEALSTVLIKTLQALIPHGSIINVYGPTEVTVDAIAWHCPDTFSGDVVPLGRSIANKKIYILDSNGKPTPTGVAGELYIAGSGVARGYLNRSDLTAKAFLPDPFAADDQSRMYKTGDLVRYLPDGNVTFLGRNDHQVKIRGYRIELGEIEARLADHPLVREAVVLALGEGSTKRLIAYVVAEPTNRLAHVLHAHITSKLPDYMVPAAFVQLDALPLTPNGKLDRRVLPEPDINSFVSQGYEPPQGETESVLATIWAGILKIDRVGRHDNFFTLGGHSLLAVQVIGRLRHIGMEISVRALFENPILSVLAQSITKSQVVNEAPRNAITHDTTRITPALLPLIDITQDDIDLIVSKVDGGVTNIQDIYALSPLQDGILFHHTMATKGDPYLIATRMSFDSRNILDRYLDAVQKVVDRHDILRTAIMWENLSTPAQVVLRHATLPVTELSLDPKDGSIADQVSKFTNIHELRIDLTQAPLIRYVISQDSDGSWIVVQLSHHIIGDNSTLEEMAIEIHAFINDQAKALLEPQPFRNLIAQVRAGPGAEFHEKFFSRMLADIDTPTLPYGLSDVHDGGVDVAESRLMLPQDLSNKLRDHAKRTGVSLATMCHLAWAQVISKTSGQEQVVFGTVLLGRMQGGSGSDRAMGLFINTLPLRVNVDGAPLDESLRQVQSDLAALIEHEHASLAFAQRCSSIPAGTHIFSAILNCRNNTSQIDDVLAINGMKILDGQMRTNYPFTMSVDDSGSEIELTSQVVSPVNASSVCGYMQEALQSLVNALDHTPKMQVRDLEILPASEREMLIRSWNNTETPYPEHLCIHQLFENQASQSPDSIAVVSGDQELTYHELNSRANSLAHYLIDLGVKPDSLIAVCVDRSLAMIIAIMAVLKAGGAYVPLDPTFASERLHDILMDASPSILLADGAGIKVLGSSISDSMEVVDPNVLVEKPIVNPRVPTLTSRHLAYVIYTSGSTGKPKGVMIEHKGVTNMALARPSVYKVSHMSRMLQFFSLSFDGSVQEIWSALCSGGALHVIPNHIRQDQSQLWEYLDRCSITHAIMTPTSLQQHQDLPQLKTPLTLILGGEALPPALLKAVQKLIPNGCIKNDYGPTEVTVDVTVWDCPKTFNGHVVPLGRQYANKKIYILDSNRKPVPIGVAGELYIGGAGVARGYLNRLDLTSKVFLPDPFAANDGSRMYKTGDLVRYLPDGNLTFLGRNDHQVKIRGYRIELGEIEARLADHPLVREAVVLAVGEGSSKRLVAYVVAEPTEGLAHTLRSHISSKLPDYMVPAAFVRLDALPLTPNGKLDRRALPEPDINSFVSQGYEAPLGETESTLAAIWAEILKIDRVGRYDNFFMLGGHSLLAVQIIGRLRHVGMEISVRALFETPTLSVLAQSITRSQAITEAPKNLITLETTRITPDLLPLIDITQEDIDLIVSKVDGGVPNIQDIYALSPLQEGILFHHTMATTGDPYLIVIRMTFRCKEILDRYLDAVQNVVDRHDILRTSIIWENLSTSAQVVLRHATLSVTEISLDPKNGSIMDQLVKLTDPREHRIDLSQAPLIRYVIAQDIDGSWVVVQLLHHTIGDHSTLEVMGNEIQAFFEGNGESLPPSEPFRNLIAQARSGPSVEVHEQFFTKMLADIDTPSLPYGLSDVHGEGFDVTETHIMLPQDLNDRLRGHAKRMGVSLASMCHLAWAQVISKTSGQEQVVFGTVLLGRMQGGSGSDRAMGLFINTLPLRIDVRGTPLEEGLRQVQSDLAALLDHEHASLAFAQRCSGVPPGTPLFSAMLNYRHNSESSDATSPILGMSIVNGQERTNYPFTMSVEDFSTELGLTSQVVCSINGSRVCEYMQEALQSLVDALDNTPKMQIRDLEILPATERETLIQSWNDTTTEYPEHLCVHQLFENQVNQSPDSIAIVYEDQQLTYRDLNSRANGLAHHLIDLGVKPDSLVAICVDRSLMMIISIMAVLKAGGAYVPLDPTFASERLHNILTDASPSIMLADDAGIKALGSSISDSMEVINPNSFVYMHTTNPHVPALTSHHLAYVIYTSGSTGKPKGVMLEHKGVTNLALTRPCVFGVDSSSKVLQFFSFSFDGSVHEIWSALCFGGSLHVLSDRTRLDQSLLWNYLNDHSITQVTLTPSVLQDCKGLPVLSNKMTLLLAGEALPLALLQTLRVLIPNGTVVNDYGPTETTVDAVGWKCPDDFSGEIAPIGRPNPNKRIYILDSNKKPVPTGVAGELYVSGAGIARGYLNRPDLTANAFILDPFTNDGSRMYKTGDLVRYLPDGNVSFIGRNDHQVKIRGYRIELGEIEARLADHPLVREAVVLAVGEGSSKRLVAYVVAEPTEGLAHTLRSHISSKLPDYMVPAAYVRLDILPLTSNGKLDHRALPEPDMDSFVSQGYEAPLGETESALATIWAETLKIDRVGRHDNFFMLGGHSLLAVQVIGRLRYIGMETSVRALFETATLSSLAQSIAKSQTVTEVPKNLITTEVTRITPELLPLIDITQDDIDLIVSKVDGGVNNIQDIYALSPLQEGILFHHTMATIGDPYLIVTRMEFDDKNTLDRYLDAVQDVIDRHDILRTAIMWENLSTPAQVVLRHATLSITELSLDIKDGSISDQIMKHTDPRKHRIDLTQAPLIQYVIARGDGNSWIVVQLLHHIIGDNSTMSVMAEETHAIVNGQVQALLEPQPFRNLIAQVRSGPGAEFHEEFFTKMLADIDTPALPYGLSNVHDEGLDVTESSLMLSQDLNDRLRNHAKKLGVSLATMCHLAWAQVISKTSGQEQVVFGTVLLGRMQGGSGSDRAMGLFINTLPFRIDVNDTSLEGCLRQVQVDLAALIDHEHASLAFAQRCSGIPAGTHIFSAILNCRNHATQSRDALEISGMKILDGQMRTNYPFTMSVDDFGTEMELTSQVVSSINATRVCEYMQEALQSLVDALDHTPKMQIRDLEILPATERETLIQSWNDTTTEYPEHLCVHQLFENQVNRSPDSIAVVYEDQQLTYRDLNSRANGLAHHLIDLGVKPDSLVAICVDRSLMMIISIMAVLKAGGAYVPLDPTFASERLHNILTDASPSIMLADDAGIKALGSSISDSMEVINPNSFVYMHTTNPHVPALTSHHLAYVIYTSGSTGKPKGVMLEHKGVTNLALTRPCVFGVDSSSKVLQFFSFSFDGSVHEIWSALCFGGSLHVLSDRTRLDQSLLWNYLNDHSITQVTLTPSVLQDCKGLPVLSNKMTLLLAGEALPLALLQTLRVLIPNGTVVNDYGPTETTVDAVGWKCPDDFSGEIAPIGRPNPNKRIYILDSNKKPVPTGVAGELYVSGAGIARGYLNRPDLTANAFILDPFTNDGSRMYKTGDLVRYLPDGNVSFIGRNDHQVKIRGYRIELGEIEARLADHPLVREAVVLAVGEGSSKRLVAYVVAEPTEGLAHTLRSHISSKLPDYMVPAAYVRMDILPLTSNGKLDHRALPEPDMDSFVSQGYEAPLGETESALAMIWAEILKIDRVGRHDNFFMLGGHSLLAVQIIERLRRVGMEISVRALFETPTLSVLAQSITRSQAITEAPNNLITLETVKITPELLPLIDLTQDDIDLIISKVDGGVNNIQDIYALSPLQDGILFHHMMATIGDPYLIAIRMSFDSKDILDRYLDAVQNVVDRHDILRTSVMWKNLSIPTQVVLRRAALSVTELSLDPINGSIMDQLVELTDPREHRIDLSQAPLIRYVIAQDTDGRWIVVQLLHHIIGDHSTLEVMEHEIQAFFEGNGESLPPSEPFRNLIAQARSGPSVEVHEQFFTKMLADIDTPSLPYGLSDVHGEGFDVTETHIMLPQDLNDRLRGHAKRMGVSLASMCHLAWAQVISKTSGQEQVVFGTVLLGRMQGGSGSDRAMGLFINTLPLRIDIGDASVEYSVRQTQIDLAALLEHEHAVLALAQRCSSVAPGTPLFSAILNYRHNAPPPTGDFGISGIHFLEAKERTNYPFDISVEDCGNALGLTAIVAMPHNPALICEYMHQALESLAYALENEPKSPIRELEILPSHERELLLKEWNATKHEYPSDQCIHHIFELQALESPHSFAAIFEDQKLTYADLNERANRLAIQLTEIGVLPEMRVALCVDRSLAMIIGLLAILKAGGAYVPLDPAYPSDRLAYMLADAEPVILLADDRGKAALRDADLRLFTILDPNVSPSSPTSSKTPNPHVRGLTPRHLAYIIYTSGSTGKPKGVMIEHQSLVNLISSRPAALGIDSESRVLQFSSLSFDASIDWIFSTLCFGGSLYIIPDHIRYDRAQMWEYMRRHSITHVELTPAVLLDCKDLSPLTTPLVLVMGGEALPPTLLQAVTALVPQGSIVNSYGPTEATIEALIWKSRGDFKGDIVPIGRPNANKRVYVLDEYRKPVPIGVAGELYIGGTGIARGYLNRPDVTAKVFLRDPFVSDDHSIMYKTGDVVRYLPDGNLIFLGRNDHQIKIRGFRIELGEIEARLADHLLVREAIVVALGEGNNKRLVAYVVAEPMDELAHTLREHVSSKLPEYMVPAAFVRLDVLPLTPNGKLDRRALPEPDIESFVSQGYEAPQGEIESNLATIWAEVLKIDRVSRNDNFFMLGGHSLLIVQIIERLRRVGMEISVRTLFENPTLSVLAQSITQSRAVTEAPKNLITLDTTRITPELLPLIDITQDDIDLIVSKVEGGVANIQDIYALSPLQDGILFHHTMATIGDPYLITAQMSFENRGILDRYLDSVQKVINRHDVLRTAILWEGLSTPAQVVLRHATLSITELPLDPADGPIADQALRLTDPREHRIDLTKAPLMRFVIAQDIDGSWTVVYLTHHIIGDNSTVAIMMNEIQLFMEDKAQTLLAPVPFRNLIAQVRSGPSAQVHEQFFTNMLSDIDTPAFPYGLSDIHDDSVEVAESNIILPQDLNNRLREHAKQLGVSLATMCHLAWAQVISKTSGQEQVVFGTVLLGRMQGGSGSDRAMGLFINTLPLRVNVDGAPLDESLRQVQSDLAALLDHEHAPLALAQRCSSVLPGTPLFSAVLNCRSYTHQSGEESGIDGITFLDGQQRTNYPFTMSVDDFGTGISLTSQVVSSINATRVCEYMQEALQSLVDALDHTPKMQIRDLEILPATERETLIQSWNDTTTEYPEHLCVHQLFENQVNQSPDSIAIVYEDQQLTYRDLNSRANGLAHHLIDLGVKPDSLVAICVDRSLMMIISIMAVLKAGGAYVPLDPTFASERLHNILTDASPSIMLADDAGIKALGSSISDSMEVINPNSFVYMHTTNPHVPALTSHHLAYVIYTSGSTGKPKGVMLEHKGVTNLALTRPCVFGVDSSSKVLQFFSFSFDGSVHEIWSALCFGGSLHVLSDRTRLDQSLLWNYLNDHSITQVTLTPSVLQDCKGLPVLSNKMTLLLAGEALPLALLQTLRVLIPNGTVVNDYGPTETTVDAVGWKCPDDFSGEIAPIGRPNPNKRIYILDSNKKPVPTGVAGELYVSGAGIARGYLNRPDLTANAFILDPFTNDGSRMYKTGDLVRYLPDGNVSFIGRNDHQVKIRGYRIELGEIEARLADHPLVREAVVLAVGEGSSKRLVAYVVAEPTEGLAHTLRSHISSKLPDYMVPAAYVRLDILPLTSNGKLDHRALPEPDMDSFVSQGYEAPLGETESALAMIWAETLKIDRVGRHDNFFTLGGHSLLAVKMVGQVRSRLGLNMQLHSLFEAPTIAAIASRIVQSDVKHDTAFDVLLPLKPQGCRPPLFCIHSVFGFGWSYVALSQHLHPDQPLYALQSRGIGGNGELAETYDGMVQDYISHIQRVQPKGPYHLLGWSFGGSIAHSIATQLEKRGEKVSLLALMDSITTYSAASGDVDVDHDADIYAEHFARSNTINTQDEGKALWIKARDVVRNNIVISKQFSPSIYSGDMIFFQATESNPVIDVSTWEPFTQGAITKHQVECAHLEMDTSKPMELIGRVLATKLEELHQQSLDV